MTTPTEGLPRLLRASALAVVTVGLSAGAHAVGGGALPGAGVLVVIAAVVLAASVVASGHRLGGRSLVALLITGQLGLHGVLETLGASGADPAALGQVHGSGHHTVLVHSASHLGTHAAHGMPHVMAHGTGMLLAHLVATVLTALVLAHGERALWLLADLVAPVIRAGEIVVSAPSPVLVVWSSIRAPHGAELVLVAPRRGPPVAVRPC